MNPYAPPATDRDPGLWRLAKRRVKFKADLYTFWGVNALLWAIWALTDRTAHPLPWPAFVTGFWGVGLLVQAVDTYGSRGRGSLAEREYERLAGRR